MFGLLNPINWVKMIISFILISLLLLIPGFKAVFADKTFSESFEMYRTDFWGTSKEVIVESFDSYKSWFQKPENQEKIEEGKNKVKDTIIKGIEKNANND